MASNINSDGIVAGYVMAGIWLVAGLMIVSNWRDYGLKYFNFGINLPLPGNGWWRRQGFKVFRGWYGGFSILFGLTILIMATVGLFNR